MASVWPPLLLACLLVLTTTASTLPPAQNLTKRVSTPESIASYNRMKEKGKLLYTWMLCHDWLAMDDPVGTTTVASLRQHGWSVERVEPVAPDEIALLRGEGVAIAPDGQLPYVSAATRPIRWPGQPLMPPTPSSDWAGYLLAPAGAIAATSIHHNRITGANDEHMSDVMMAIWRDTCATEGAPVAGFRRYYGTSIINVPTWVAWERGQEEMFAMGTRETFTPDGPDSDTFFALLGSPSAALVAYMLLDYSHELGQKIVTSINMEYSEYFSLVMRVDVGDWSSV